MGRMGTDVDDTALWWHLKLNHCPSLPDCVFDLAKKAIKLAKKGKWDAQVSLKKTGISWRGQDWAPVSACISAWHLESFIED